MSGMKKFSFDLAGNVTAMYEVKGSKMKIESIRNTTFETATGQYISGGQGVVEVTATKVGYDKVETKVYSDQDGDGRFIENFEFEVLTATPYKKENYKFEVIGDSVVKVEELGKRGWKVDRIDFDEDYSVAEINGDKFVLKTESDYHGVEFDIYVDRDSDGLWTKIAEGQSSDAYLNLDGSIDLIGIVTDGLLTPADVVLV